MWDKKDTMKQTKGFTLIELLIVIAIVGILAIIAYPSLQSYLIKSRRSEAQNTLIKAQLKQSSLHILNPTYSTDKSAIGLIDSQYYTFSVVSAATSTFVLKAVAKSGSGQDNDDSACTTMFIDQDSHHSSDGSINNDSCW